MPTPRKPEKSRIVAAGTAPVTVVDEIVEKRCHACQSPHRRVIDKLLVLPNISYSEIGRMFDIDRRSISNHSREHLNYEEAAIREIIRHEADSARENLEDGIKGATSRRVFLNVYLQKTMQALVDGELELTGKDAMGAIQMLEKLDSDYQGTAIDEITLEFNAFQQAMGEICPADMWDRIIRRAREIYAGEPTDSLAVEIKVEQITTGEVQSPNRS